MTIRRDGTVPRACSTPTGLQIKPSMAPSTQWYPLRMSDQPFQLRGLRFRSSPRRQCQLVHPNIPECQYVPPMSPPRWTLMPHAAGMPFRCFAGVAENPDTLQGSARRLMTSATCLRTKGKTGLNASSPILMWQLQRLNLQLRRLRRFHRNARKVQKGILRPTAGELYAPAVY